VVAETFVDDSAGPRQPPLVVTGTNRIEQQVDEDTTLKYRPTTMLQNRFSARTRPL
jgi:hypothetical protein